MAFTQQLLYEPLRSIDSSTFTGSYQALGSSLIHPCALIRIVNRSNVDVTISVDGVTDHDIIPANGFFTYDVTANTPPSGDNAIFAPQGRQYYVKGSASSGLVYLVAQYIVQV